jgi:uncharacterized membrane protein YuzA (DUF378 family)
MPRRRPKKVSTRPLGVTIICVLGWIGALFSLLGGLTLLGFGMTAYNVASMLYTEFGTILGVTYLLFGLAGLLMFYWLWHLKKQGWRWAMIIESLMLAMSLLEMNIVGMIIPGIIVIYLWTNKNLFK